PPRGDDQAAGCPQYQGDPDGGCARLVRLTPRQAFREVSGGELVDIRPAAQRAEQRAEQGEMCISLLVLGWPRQATGNLRSCGRIERAGRGRGLARPPRCGGARPACRTRGGCACGPCSPTPTARGRSPEPTSWSADNAAPGSRPGSAALLAGGARLAGGTTPQDPPDPPVSGRPRRRPPPPPPAPAPPPRP